MPLAGPDAEVLAEIGNAELVTGIIAADHQAINEFYRRFIRGLRYFLRGQGVNTADIEDLAHDTIFLVVRQLQKSGLDNAACLAGFVRTIALRQVFAKRVECARYADIDSATAAEFTPDDRGLNPEQMVLVSEKSALLRQALAHLKPADVEILTRFYLQNQTRKHIEAEMGLSETQFRLQKSRAKSRLEKEAKRIADAGAAASARRRLLDKRAA